MNSLELIFHTFFLELWTLNSDDIYTTPLKKILEITYKKLFIYSFFFQFIYFLNNKNVM